MRALGMGANGAALTAARRALQEEPNDLDLLAVEAIALARTGRHRQALVAFGGVPGGTVYEQLGLGEHALALRKAGDADAAAALREERWIAAETDRVELGSLLHRVDDLLAAGDRSGAFDVSLQALARAPAAADAHAAHAEVLFSLGDVEEAHFHLLLCAPASTRGLLLRGAVALSEGDLSGADRDLVEVRRRRPQWARGAAVRAHALVALGTPEDAVSLLDMPAFASSEDPDLLRARALAYAGLGRSADARAVLAGLAQMYPDLRAAGPARLISEGPHGRRRLQQSLGTRPTAVGSGPQ